MPCVSGIWDSRLQTETWLWADGDSCRGQQLYRSSDNIKFTLDYVDSHHPMLYKLWTTGTALKEGKKDKNHTTKSLKDYLVAFFTSTKKNENQPDKQHYSVLISQRAGTWGKKLTRIFNKPIVPVHFKPCYKTPRQKLKNMVCAVQISEECIDLYISAIKSPTQESQLLRTGFSHPSTLRG